MTPGARARPSPWRSTFARRTYLASVLWVLGIATSWVLTPTAEPAWLRVRLDPAGLLYLAAALIGGMNFFPAGFRAGRRLRLDMNFLMSAAVLAALLIGESFEAATLAALFSFAELLERFAVDRSRRSIAALVELAPEQAERIREDGGTDTVAAAALVVGDRIRARPGSRIGADGVVVAGTSAVNQAAVTGESMPVLKVPGDPVYSGTLNTDGALDIEVTADAGHSVLARIVALVRAAEGRRAPIEGLIERFAGIYTPAVTLLAVVVIVAPPLVGLGDRLEWFLRGITLLVIACPCALVIATPVTVVSALTSAARHGVLIKGGEHLERLGTVRALAVDKTGTLTSGNLQVTGFETTGDASADRGLLALIASAEFRSEHPIGRAIVEYAAARGVEADLAVTSFTSRPGKGIVVEIGGVMISVGTEALVGPDAAAVWGPQSGGATSVFAVTSDGRAARLSLTDTVRPEALALVGRLHELGIRPVVLLTGDQAGPAEEMGRRVGVDLIVSRLLPDGKVSAVRDLRDKYGAVAMVGDGVNDAPALAESSVGIAMGAAGSPATIETADVALMADDLTRLPYAIRLARLARRTVRFNIGVALGLKLALAVGAVFGEVSLAVAVIVGDMGGSLLVTANALRLANLHPPGNDDHHMPQGGPSVPGAAG